MEKIKVFIVDDHKIFREGLRNLIDIQEIAEVIGEAENGKIFIEKLSGLNPDIVLMDISMPEMNGIEATKKALEINPNIRIIALSSFGDEEYYYKMIEAGVQGFLLKNSSIVELESALAEVFAGDNFFSIELLKRVISTIGKKNEHKENQLLNEKEIDLLMLICEGLDNDEIAERLAKDSFAIENEKMKLFTKTNCKNTASLIIYAIKNQYIKV